MKGNCEFCGKEFESERKSRRFCNRLCSHNSWVLHHSQEWKSYNADWRQEHPDYWREYWASGKGIEVQHKRHQRHPLERKARSALDNAVRLGKIARPNICQICGVITKPEAHHWQGYDPDHWLDVQWLCHQHHLEADRL